MTKRLAEELKEARLKKDITLQQLFVRTRIDIKFLEAIENGNFEVLPEVYLKAFIKSYASAVGLDETTIIKKFEAAKSGKDFEERHAPESHPVHREEKRVEPKRPEPKRPEPKIEKKREYVSYDASASEGNEESGTQRRSSNNLIWIALAGVVLIVALLLYLIFFRGSSTQIITEKPYDEYLEKNSQRFEDTTASNNPASNNPAAGKTDSVNNTAAAQQAAAAPKSDSLSLLIKSSGQSWIKVTPDNSTKSYEFILQPNTQKSVKAKKNFHLIIGNSGDVKLQLNNSQLNFVGKAGEVRVAQIDSSGLVYSRSSKPSTTAKPKTTDNPVNGDKKR